MTTVALETMTSELRAVSPPKTSEAAVRTHLHSLWRYLRMQGAKPDEADDLAQESFVIAAQKGAIDLEPAATATFLRRTARFLLLRDRRGDREATLLAHAVDALWQRDCLDRRTS